MATTVDNRIPAYIRTEIHQGSPWPGVRVRYVDADGNEEAVTVTATVATGTSAEGGRWLMDCDVASEAVGTKTFYRVDLDGDATALLPARRVEIDVYALRSGDTYPQVVVKAEADVIASNAPEPV